MGITCRLLTISLTLALAGCATPQEVRDPPGGPGFVEPTPIPDLPRYQMPVQHAAPLSDATAPR